MKRLEQQVDPKLDTPAGLYPSAAPVHVNTPPIAPVIDPRQVDGVLRNLAGLSIQLGKLRREADNEADELAMTEFNGYRSKRERELLAEFAELDINDQSDDAIRSMATTFGEALDDYARNLPFSERRREAVNSLIRSCQMQTSGRLKAESIANKARWINTVRKRQYDEALAAGNTALVRELHGQMTAKGQDPGKTLEQAVSGAARNQYLAALPTLDAEQLDRQIDVIREDLGTDRSEFDCNGDKISRGDLAKVLHAAKKLQREHYEEASEAIQQLKANGELDQNKLDEMLKTKAIDARQHRVYSRELEEEARQLRRATYVEIHDRIYELLTEYETDPQSEELNLQLTALVGQVDGLRQEGKLEITHAKTLRNLVDSFYKKADAAERERARSEAARLKEEDRQIAFRRNIMLGGIEDRLRSLEFRPGDDEYSPRYLGLRDEIMNNDKLTGKERNQLRKVLAGRVTGVWKDKDGEDVDKWLRKEFIKTKKNKDGRTVNEYRGLGYGTGWFDGEKAIKDQEFQRQRYEEIRNYAGKLLNEGKTPVEVQRDCRELVKKLYDAELPNNAKRFVIEAVKPARDSSAEAARVRQLADMLPVDRKTRIALDIEAKTKGKTVARTAHLGDGSSIKVYADNSAEVTMPDGTVKLGKLTPGGGIEFPDEVKK